VLMFTVGGAKLIDMEVGVGPAFAYVWKR
jgi:hypothetical protein